MFTSCPQPVPLRETKIAKLSISFEIRIAVDMVQTRIQTDNFTDIRQVTKKSKSRDSSVGIALGYGLDDRGSRV
jgi:hypothetical protein